MSHGAPLQLSATARTPRRNSHIHSSLHYSDKEDKKKKKEQQTKKRADKTDRRLQSIEVVDAQQWCIIPRTAARRAGRILSAGGGNLVSAQN